MTMIFQHTWKQVLDGTKTQTRRLVKCNDTSRVGSYYKIEELLPPNDRLWWWWDEDRPFPGKGVYVVEGINGGWLDGNTPVDPEWTLKAKWVIGRTYAVQPGRGRPCIHRRYTYNDEWTYSAGKPEGNGGKQWTPCRIRITGIRQERLQGIATVDAIAEGCPAIHKGGILYSPIDRYADLWDSIHTKPGETWADNPLVWVLEFELVR